MSEPEPDHSALIEREPRRFTAEPDPEGWAAADVPDSERVDDDFIAAELADPSSPVRAFAPLQPEDERLFPVEASD